MVKFKVGDLFVDISHVTTLRGSRGIIVEADEGDPITIYWFEGCPSAGRKSRVRMFTVLNWIKDGIVAHYPVKS